MELLQLISHIRCPFLDMLMLAVTTMGDETAFLVVALIVFWCVDKRNGYYILSVGFLGTILNQFLKLLCKVPRPWFYDENIAPMRELVGADGYSFPSGHSQNSVGTFGGISIFTKNKIISVLCIALCILVPFSRMYFGVHTPQDVLVGSGMALLLVFGLKPIVLGKDGKYFPWLLLFMSILSLAYLWYAQCYLSPEGLDAHSYHSGLKNAYTLAGALFGILVVYPVEKKFIQYSEKAVWWAQILKVVLGLTAVLLVKEGLKTPLTLMFTELPGRMVRYFLTVIVAGIIWPLTFRWFGSMGKKD